VADWNPEQYRQFAKERGQAFYDLLEMIEPAQLDRAVDLGCGPGELTTAAAAQLDVGEMIGIDNSPAMLDKAAEHVSANVRFEFGDQTSIARGLRFQPALSVAYP